MSVQAYRESLDRLLRKRDTYVEFVASIPRSPLGVGKRPDSNQQMMLYDLTEGFHDQAYKTLSALVSVHSRIRIADDMPRGAISSNERFLTWWGEAMGEERMDPYISAVASSRDFRTLVNHPAGNALFDWRTASTHEDVFVILHGHQTSTGRIPAGATPSPAANGDWQFFPPDMNEVLRGFEQLSMVTFGVMPSLFPLDDGEQYCTWEPDGVGSTIGDQAAIALHEAISVEDLEIDRLLAPGTREGFSDYISAMQTLRERAARRTDLPSAYPLNSNPSSG
jgi:hypothetical protein